MDNLKELTVLDLKQRIEEQWIKAPITTAHIGLGTSLYALNLIGVIPTQSLLFHPSLAFSPNWQIYRTITSFLVMGRSASDVFYRSVAMYYLHSPLEEYMDVTYVSQLKEEIYQTKETAYSTYDNLKSQIQHYYNNNGKPPTAIQRLMMQFQVYSKSFWRKSSTLLSQVSNSPYFKILALSCGFIVAIELFFFKESSTISPEVSWSYSQMDQGTYSGNASNGYPDIKTLYKGLVNPGFTLLFPRSLFPNLDYSLRWLWAICGSKEVVSMFGVFPMRPVYVPVLLCALSGFKTWPAMLKGLACSLFVSYVMKLRRPDGQLVVDYTIDLGKYWITNSLSKIKQFLETSQRVLTALAQPKSNSD